MLATAIALGGAACSSDPDIPYKDDAANGRLGLFDAEGRPVTKGNINDKPFVVFAVSDEKATPPHDKPGRKAALLAFQPREGVAPASWGGDFLTGSTPYSDANRPTAHGTEEDITLANFLAVFPIGWGGVIQLRMYLSAPEAPGRTDRYATAEIRVDGDTWSLVGKPPDIPGGPSMEPAGEAK